MVSGSYHEQHSMSKKNQLSWRWRQVRHVFGFTLITEASIGAAPPGNNIAQCRQQLGILYGACAKFLRAIRGARE